MSAEFTDPARIADSRRRCDLCSDPLGERECVRSIGSARKDDKVAFMTHEVIALLTLLLSLVSAIGVLWIALRLERVAGT